MKTVDVVIETVKGSNSKYTYEPGYGFFRLKKLLPVGMVFPYDFGFIPGTKGDDGDPLDAIVFSEFKNFPGCKIECRLIGSIQVMQTDNLNKKMKIRNDRFFVVPIQSIFYKTIASITELPGNLMNELEAFFIQYNKLEHKVFKITGRSGATKSLKIISNSIG